MHISLLPNDYYHFEPGRHEIYGERSNLRFRLGDVVKVKVVRVDLDQRQIDFMLAETDLPVRKTKKKKKKSLL